jgi:hypothetical protein
MDNGFPIFLAAIALPVLAYFLSNRSSDLLSQSTFDLSAIPPDEFVSDDEYFAACAPGVSMQAAFTVRRIIAEVGGMPEHTIHPNDRLVDDLGIE